MRYTLILLLSFMYQTQLLAEVYQWRDDNGMLHFSDKRPANEDLVIDVPIVELNTIPGDPKYSGSLIDRAKNIPNAPVQNKQKPFIGSITKKKKHITKTSSAYKPGFRGVTGFDNEEKLDKSRENCIKNRGADCSTKTLVNKQKAANWARSDEGQAVIRANQERMRNNAR
ncbi:MAG: DUF4124 domain-containing protein [Gammaproteobacteria bacterium]|nr:DUF4124 domain-containing protein [Gammaproteobacteria bacterium]